MPTLRTCQDCLAVYADPGVDACPVCDLRRDMVENLQLVARGTDQGLRDLRRRVGGEQR